MSEPSDRLINLFGALILGVGDRMRSAMMEGLELGGEAAAAVIVIGYAPGLSIDQLARVLRLSHPGAVRLIDRLVSADLAERTVASHDRRVAVLTLTDQGRSERSELLARRHKVLATILHSVAPDDAAMLESIAAVLLRTLPVDATTALTVCRFCDGQVCVDCPMGDFGSLMAAAFIS